MDDPTLPLPGLSPVAGRSVKACLDGGSLSSDAGVLVLREIEHRRGAAERLARCLDDPRDPALNHPHAGRHDPLPHDDARGRL